MRRFLLAILLATTAALSGCDDDDSPSGPSEEVYALARVNGAALPAPVTSTGGAPVVLEITGGSLVLRGNGTFRETQTIRCQSPVPAGTTCPVTQPEQSREGTYSLAEGWVSVNGTRYSLRAEGSTITLSYVLPPSQGLFQTIVLEYRR